MQGGECVISAALLFRDAGEDGSWGVERMDKMLKNGLVVLATGVAVSIAQAEITPSVELQEKFTDNVYKQAHGRQESLISAIKPGIQLTGSRGGSEYVLGANTEAGYYTVDTRNDYVDWSGYGRANLEFTPRHHVLASAKQSHGHDDIGAGANEGIVTLPDAPDEYDQTDTDVGYTFGAKDAKGRLVLRDIYMGKDYSNHTDSTTFLDREDNEVRGTAYLQVMPKTSLLLEGRQKSIDYSRSYQPGSIRDSEERRIYVGAEWEATAKTTGSIRLGNMTKDFSSQGGSAAVDDYSLPSWEAIVSWKPRSYSMLTLDSSQGALEATSGNTFIFRTSHKLSWDHEWSSRFSSNVFGQYYNDEYKGTDRQDGVRSAGAGVRYGLSDQLALSARYVFSDRNSDSAVRDYDYLENALTVGVKWETQ